MITRIGNRALHPAAVFAIALTALLIFAPQSRGEVTQITAGELRWGIKHSFRNYITTGAAQGTITASGGAQICSATLCDSDGVAAYPAPPIGPSLSDHFRFGVVSGEFDSDTNELDLTLAGTVSFYGHEGALNLTFSNLRVELRHDVSVIKADVDFEPLGGGGPQHATDTNVVELELDGVEPIGEGELTTWNQLETGLTAAGKPFFDGVEDYPVGQPFDLATIAYEGPGESPFDPAPPAGFTSITRPSSQSVTIGARSESVPTNFTAAATGDDPITVQWQQRRSGEATWSDVDGATLEQFSPDATLADDGTRYRAVFTNANDDVATTPAALLRVSVLDVIAPQLTLHSPVDGGVTSEASVQVHYSVVDNDDPDPSCTLTDGALVPLKLGVNVVTVTCVDELGGNQASVNATLTRILPLPAVPKVKNAKSVKLRRGRGTSVVLGRVTCMSQTTCLYKLPHSIKVKVGKLRFAVKVKGPKLLEPEKTGTIRATVPASLVSALKQARKRTKLSVPVRVTNREGRGTGSKDKNVATTIR